MFPAIVPPSCAFRTSADETTDFSRSDLLNMFLIYMEVKLKIPFDVACSAADTFSRLQDVYIIMELYMLQKCKTAIPNVLLKLFQSNRLLTDYNGGQFLPTMLWFHCSANMGLITVFRIRIR